MSAYRNHETFVTGGGVCRPPAARRASARTRALGLAVLVAAVVGAALDARAQDVMAFPGPPMHDASVIVGAPSQSVLVGQQPDSYDGVVVPEGAELAPFADGAAVYPGASCPECQSGACSCTHGGASRRRPHGFLNRLFGPKDGRWVVQVDALMLWPANIQSRPLLENAFTGETALDVADADAPMSAGGRYGLIYGLDACHALEGNYFNVGRFPGRQLVVDEAGDLDPVDLPVATPSPNFGDILETEGRIQSAEFNWRHRHCGSPVTWIAGFRWVQWNQRLGFAAAGDDGSFGAILSEVGNDLYGGQLGADVSLWNAGGRFTVNGVGKAGVFGNVAWQRMAGVENFDGDITVDGPLAADADRAAFFGEVGLNGSLAITRWLSWRLGYSLFWLSGVAVPGNQISEVDFTDGTADINTSGSVLLHGATTGLEARW